MILLLHVDASQLSDLKGIDRKKLADEAALLVSQIGENVLLRRAFCVNVSDDLCLTDCSHPTV